MKTSIRSILTASAAIYLASDAQNAFVIDPVGASSFRFKETTNGMNKKQKIAGWALLPFFLWAGLGGIADRQVAAGATVMAILVAVYAAIFFLLKDYKKNGDPSN